MIGNSPMLAYHVSGDWATDNMDMDPVMPAETEKSDGTLSLRESVEQVINMIRPAIQGDGGDLELVEVTDQGVVKVRLHGECVGCPSSEITLRMGVERALKERVAGVVSVEQI
jgi:Fe-S cluster biogenesis protein NfuA